MDQWIRVILICHQLFPPPGRSCAAEISRNITQSFHLTGSQSQRAQLGENKAHMARCAVHVRRNRLSRPWRERARTHARTQTNASRPVRLTPSEPPAPAAMVTHFIHVTDQRETPAPKMCFITVT